MARGQFQESPQPPRTEETIQLEMNAQLANAQCTTHSSWLMVVSSQQAHVGTGGTAFDDAGRLTCLVTSARIALLEIMVSPVGSVPSNPPPIMPAKFPGNIQDIFASIRIGSSSVFLAKFSHNKFHHFLFAQKGIHIHVYAFSP